MDDQTIDAIGSAAAYARDAAELSAARGRVELKAEIIELRLVLSGALSELSRLEVRVARLELERGME